MVRPELLSTSSRIGGDRAKVLGSNLVNVCRDHATGAEFAHQQRITA